ncbi:hypothetical protein JCM21900_003540 [Sporobolomyces salmonicolor]
MPARSRPQQHTPGIINLPQPKSLDATSSVASSNASRHSGSSPRPKSTSLPDKPLPTLDLSAVKSNEVKKRRRAKGPKPESPLKQSSTPGLVEVPPLASGDAPADDSSNLTQGRRRRGRANRQISPPLPESDSSPEHPQPALLSTTPPQSGYDSNTLHHSRSFPADSSFPRHHQHPHSQFSGTQSSGDEWDMPIGKTEVGKPKESLSWQQELLQSGASTTHNKVRAKADSPLARPRSRGVGARDTRFAPSSKPRPALHASVSDNSAVSGGPSLNWQQELLLNTDIQASLLSDRHTHSSSPTKNSNLTPARQRQQRIKDNITFGLGDLDLNDSEEYDLDDVFASPASRQNSGRRQNRSRTAPSPATAVVFSTPTKQSPAPAEPRYAGPTFHNSPAPSSLPVPSFLLRRQAAPSA